MLTGKVRPTPTRSVRKGVALRLQPDRPHVHVNKQHERASRLRTRTRDLEGRRGTKSCLQDASHDDGQDRRCRRCCLQESGRRQNREPREVDIEHAFLSGVEGTVEETGTGVDVSLRFSPVLCGGVAS